MGLGRKLIIFTEHRDTLNYLERRVTQLLGRREAVVAIHGAVPGMSGAALRPSLRPILRCKFSSPPTPRGRPETSGSAPDGQL